MGEKSRKMTGLTRQYDEKVKAGDWQGAKEIAETMVSIAPDQSIYYIYRGFVHYKLGQRDKAEQDFAQALVLAPNSPGVPQWWLSKMAQERSRAELGATASEQQHYLVFYPYRWLHLHPKKVFRIGRSLDNDLVIPNNDVSRVHATVGWDGNGYLLKDLGSTNRTSVNGGYIDEHYLQNGDVINIGNTILYYLTEDEGGKIEDNMPRPSHHETYKISASKTEPPINPTKMLSGDLEYISIWQVLQILSADKKSGCLSLYSKEQGRIFLEQGVVVHCELLGQIGEQAFYLILPWQKGRFEFDPELRPEQTSMDHPVEYLLFRGACHLDEQQKRIE